MLDAVNTGLNCSLYPIISIGMAHHCKTFFMCNMYHFFHFGRRKRSSRDLSVILKIQKAGSHDLDKISPFLSGFQNSAVIFLHIRKTFSDNFSIMPFFINGKNRRAVINSIFCGKLRGSSGNTIMISSVSYKTDSSFLVFLKMAADQHILWPVFLCLNGVPVIIAIEKYMCMTFSKHFHHCSKNLLISSSVACTDPCTKNGFPPPRPFNFAFISFVNWRRSPSFSPIAYL